jgi:hypothetical protein
MERIWKTREQRGATVRTFFVFKLGARLNKPNLLSLAATSCGLDRMVRRGRRFESVRGLQESAARAGPSLVSSLQLFQHARGWNRFWNSQTENGFDFVVSSGNEAIFEDSGVEHRSAVDHQRESGSTKISTASANEPSCLNRLQGMEPSWSPVVATTGNPSQVGVSPKSAGTSQNTCRALRQVADRSAKTESVAVAPSL